MKAVISIFLLPFEIEDFAVTLNALKRNSAFIDNSIYFKVDITLCLSAEMTDWETSKLSKVYIQERTTELCRVYLDWCEYDLYVEFHNTIIGCLSHRRKSWKKSLDADFFIWLDTDIFFKDITLSCMTNSFVAITKAGYEEFILTPQIVRQWDTTWDILVNKNYINKNINYQAEANIYTDALIIHDQINIAQIPNFKFAGGWFSIISKKLLDRIGLPDSLGHYGPDDTFIMVCCALMQQKGYNVHQFVLENLVVGELYKYKTNSTIKKYINSKNRKDEFKKIAESNIEKELNTFSFKMNQEKQNNQKYIHDEITHDMEAPSILVPLFIEMFNPKDVCDVGCGIGNFLDIFKKLGVKNVLGYDGEWTNKELLAKHLNVNEFETIDFEKQLPGPSKMFDLAMCLEVGEHISSEKSDEFVAFLTELSHTIIFSAAIPYQGGYNHINEQWEEYWEEKFNRKGYKKYDIIRHKIFMNKKIKWWYRQNIIVYSKRELSHFPAIPLTNIIMPDLFVTKVNVINQLLSSKIS